MNSKWEKFNREIQEISWKGEHKTPQHIEDFIKQNKKELKAQVRLFRKYRHTDKISTLNLKLPSYNFVKSKL